MKKLKLSKFMTLLFILFEFFAFSQEKEITGKVIDESNQPIFGVTVLLKGTAIGTTSDIDGNYVLKVSGDSDVVVFSYIGFDTKEITIGDKTTINVTLREGAAQLDEIVLTGFRGAEQRAMAIKRKAASVVEAITPEDFGNYSDENMADALQRVPGLQVERDDSGNGGGDRVSIRGVGPQFVKVTINGRTPLSAGSEGIDQLRQFNLDVLPTEVVQGAIVYKSSEAHLVEPGLGGAVDFQTVKPLSLRYKPGKNHFAVINTRGDYNDYGDNKALKPRLSGILGIKTEDDKFGLVLSAITSSTRRAFDSYNMSYLTKDVSEETENGTVVHEGVLTPGLTRYNPVRNSQDRVGISTAAQWKIAEHWEANADFLYTKFDNYSTRDQFRVFAQLETNANNIFPTSDLSIDNNNVLRYFDNTNAGNAVTRVGLAPTQYDNLQSSYMAGFNLKFENNGWKIVGDYSLSNIDFDQRLAFTQTWINVPSLSFDLTGDFGVFNWDEAEASNSANATVRPQPFLRDIMFEGENHAFRLDLDKEINDNVKVRFGGRYSATELASRQAQLTSAQDWSADFLDADAYFDTYVTGSISPAFANGDRNIGTNSWVSVNQALIRANNPAVFNQTAGTSFEGDLFNVNNGALPLLTQNSWELEETTMSVYGQIDFNTELFGKSVSGNVGVRAAHWEVEGRAFSTIAITDPSQTVEPINFDGVPTTASSDRWDVMPSLNLNFELKDNFNLRFSAVNTVSRPDYLDLRPTNTLSYINPDSPDAGSVNGTATLSNPNLQPFNSWQFDATGEWYNNAGGAVVLSGFYKLIDDFIIDETTFGSELSDFGDINFGVDATGIDDQVFDVTSPVNFTGVKLYGLEVGFRQPLSFISDALTGFGVQANYTYVNSEFDDEINEVDNSFPGSSKHNLNSVLYYDGQVFGVRVAYNTRSSFLRNIGGGSDIRSNITYTDGFDRLDVRANLEVTKSLQLSLSCQNLTASDRRDYINNDPSLFTQLTYQKPVYTIGARYAF